jgi:hypothetical protein
MLFNRVAKNSQRVIRRSPVGPDELIVKQILMDLDLRQGFRSVILRYFNAAGADGRKIAASLVADNAGEVLRSAGQPGMTTDRSSTRLGTETPIPSQSGTKSPKTRRPPAHAMIDSTS